MQVLQTLTDSIYPYLYFPFYPNAKSWKPSGSVNFSRIESAQLELLYNIPNGKTLPQGTWYVNARSFNELRIKGGMGGKRFAS